MERLQIVFAGKGFDLLVVEEVGSAGERCPTFRSSR
jgi:hypothetical protein